MELTEYKKLSLEFREELQQLESDIEDVALGDIEDPAENKQIIEDAREKLKLYDQYVETLEARFVSDFKSDVQDVMEYIRQQLEVVGRS